MNSIKHKFINGKLIVSLSHVSVKPCNLEGVFLIYIEGVYCFLYEAKTDTFLVGGDKKHYSFSCALSEFYNSWLYKEVCHKNLLVFKEGVV